MSLSVGLMRLPCRFSARYANRAGCLAAGYSRRECSSMPTVLRAGRFRFFFYSNEGRERHIFT